MRITPIHRLLLLITLMTFLLIGCATNNQLSSTTLQPKSHTFFIFDTVVQVKIYDDRANSSHFDDIEALMQDIDHKISRTNSTSEVSAINQAAGQAPVQVSPDTYELIATAYDYAVRSEGRFDPAIGNLVSLWNIGHEGAHVPPIEQITAATRLCDYRKIDLNEQTHEVYLQEAGMSIDLGSIGKGYAADMIADYLTAHDFHSAIIDLGGNVFALGLKPGGKPWTVGIQDPDQERGIPIGTIQVENKTIVTSGIYERFFIEDGKLYQHIIDPTTGYPVENNISSVTILTDHSTDADALSTTLFVLGIDEGLKLIENTPNTDAMYITKDKVIHATSGFTHLFNKTNDDYIFAD